LGRDTGDARAGSQSATRWAEDPDEAPTLPGISGRIARECRHALVRWLGVNNRAAQERGLTS